MKTPDFSARRAMTALLFIGAAGTSITIGSGCEQRTDLDGRRRAIPGLDPAGSVDDLDDTRLELSFDVIDNIAAATIYHDGGLVSSGRGVGFALLARGGAPGQWKLGSGAHPRARVDGQVAFVHFSFDSDPGGIDASGDSIPVAFHFEPATRNQLASVFINDEKISDVPMLESGSAEYTFALPRRLVRQGDNEIRIFFRGTAIVDGLRTAGSLERLAIGRTGVGAKPVVQVGSVSAGDKAVEALTLSGSSRVSVHLRVPSNRPRLRLQVAGNGTASVRIKRDGAASRELWRTAATGEWQPTGGADLDLSEFAGKIVRLDFRGEGEIHWGRPAVFSETAKSPPTAQATATEKVILWVVSGLRTDAARAAPNLLALAEGGQFFDGVSRTPVAGMGLTEIFSGSMAVQPTIAAEVQTLAENFSAAGFQTTLVSSAPVVAGDAQGFDRVVRVGGADAVSVWRRGADVLRTHGGKRSLLVLLVDDPALPWNPAPGRIAEPWRSVVGGKVQPGSTKWLSVSPTAQTFSERDRDYVKALYAGEVAAVDEAIGAMSKDLIELGLRDRSAVIVTGDRPMALFESESFGEPVELSPATYSVPIVIHAAGDQTAETGHRSVRVLADVYATALELAQLPTPAGIDGVSLLAPTSPGRVGRLRLPNRARGLVANSLTWVSPLRGEEVLFASVQSKDKIGSKDTGSRAKEATTGSIRPEAMAVSASALIAWHSLLSFADSGWDHRRWGQVTSLRSAFSAEHR